MVAFLMLGIIPGTNIQIDFNTWLIIMGIVSVLLCVLAIQRSHVLEFVLISRAIRHADPTAILTTRLA
jgi:hypothetical protein